MDVDDVDMKDDPIEVDKNADESVNQKSDSEAEKSNPKNSKQTSKPENSDESEDENKLEKNSLEKSFDISSDEEDDEEDKEARNRGEKNNDDEENADKILDTNAKSGSAKSKTDAEPSSLAIPSTSSDAKSKTEASLKRTQGTENSAKELARKRKLEQMEEENKKMQVLMANFSEEQLNRYEVFRRSAFQKSTVKKIIQTVGGKSVSASVVIAMSGIAKVYIGEIVERALDLKTKWDDTGPIQPKHLREAFRLLKNESKVATSLRTKNTPMFF